MHRPSQISYCFVQSKKTCGSETILLGPCWATYPRLKFKLYQPIKLMFNMRSNPCTHNWVPASLFQLLDFLCPIDNTPPPPACLVHVNCVAKRPPIQCVITSAANLHISVEQTLPSSQNSFKIANFAAKGIISCLFLRQLASPRRSVLSIWLLFRQASSKSTNIVFPTQM